jgi:iron-sulfur cluster assembly accessory protein
MGARIHIPEGETLLERLLEDGVDIGHDCGGKLACSTCRVSVHGEAGEASEDELDILDRSGAGPSERLACQVTGPADLEVRLQTTNVPMSSGKPVRITPEAARHLATQLKGAAGVRLTVEHSGCSGLRHRIEPASRIGAEDSVFECHGVNVVVAPLDLPFVGGTVIDLEQVGLARKLRFSNPNATSSCGCGESFGTA